MENTTVRVTGKYFIAGGLMRCRLGPEGVVSLKAFYVDSTHVDCVLPAYQFGVNRDSSAHDDDDDDDDDGGGGGAGGGHAHAAGELVGLQLSNDAGTSWGGGSAFQLTPQWSADGHETAKIWNPNVPDYVNIALILPNRSFRFKSAAVASVAALNADSTVLPGVELRLLIRDNEYNAERAASIGNETAATVLGLLGTVGGYFSTMTIPFSLQVSTPWRLPFIGMGASAAELGSTAAHPFFVRLCSSNKDIAAGTAALCRKMGWRRIGILTTDDAYAGGLGALLLRDMGGVGAGSYHGTFDGTVQDNGLAAATRHAAEIVKNGLQVVFVESSLRKDTEMALAALTTARGNINTGYIVLGSLVADPAFSGVASATVGDPAFVSLAIIPGRKSCALTESGCKAAARRQGLSIGGAGWAFSGNFITKGCYTYSAGEFTGRAYYGTGGTGDQLSEKPSCALLDDGIIRTSQLCLKVRVTAEGVMYCPPSLYHGKRTAVLPPSPILLRTIKP